MRDSGFSWLPLGRLNLRRNPFGELERAERLRAAVVDTKAWADFVSGPRCAVQFVGPCGHGKSTHLFAMIRDCGLDLDAYVYLPPRTFFSWQRPIERTLEFTIRSGAGTANRDSGILVLDEAQRVPRPRRKRLFLSYSSLLLGTHVDLSPVLRRAGFEVMTVEVSGECTPQRIADVVNRRISLSRLHPAADVPHCSVDDGRRLYNRYGSNLRAIESRLYNVFQQLAGTTHGEVRFSD